MKIALVHDYLNSWGGAEEVLYVLHEIWPEAPIYTIYSKVGQRNDLISRKFGRAQIIQSWFGKIPFCEKLISPLRFLIPAIWSGLDFSQYDLIFTSASWAITKGLATGKTKEICYCHTPPRYLYGYETSKKQNRLIKIYSLIIGHFMRQYDFRQARKVDFFIANSREVQQRIKKFYRRESTIIYPPVEIPSQAPAVKIGDYFLAGGRLERPKNFDLIIKACNKLKLSLKIYGIGSQGNYLKSIASSTIEFFGQVSDEEKQELFFGCQAFICAATDEDFGITPVLAMAAGRPVIAYRGGGYLETVVAGKTGEFFDEPIVESLVSKLQSFLPVGRQGKASKYKSEDCRAQAKKFSKERFIKEIKEYIKKYG